MSSEEEAAMARGSPQLDKDTMEECTKDETIIDGVPQDKAPQDRSEDHNSDDNVAGEEVDAAKPPMCMCPACDKVLVTLKSLFGHYGRTHKTSIERDAIKYACPFCDVDVTDDGPEHKLFDTTDELESHVVKSHPKCKLLGLLESESSPKKKTSQTQPRRKRSLKRQESDKQSPASNAAKSSHPRCKCPSCDKILPPQSLFGHFGRVHSGQFGHIDRFEWKNVSYACPFCPNDDDGEPPRIYRTYELVEAHVASHHPDCHLRKPNALKEPKPGGGSPESNSAMPARKSRRNSRYSSMGGDDDDEDEAVATRKSRRSRRPVDNGAMIMDTEEEDTRGKRPAMARQKNTEDEEKTLYNCPECDKTNLTKHGLHAHYGMKHGGKVDLEKCIVIKPKASKKKAMVAGTPKTGPWTDEEHAAFIEGHRLHGNRWKRISVEFVPTRDPKQVGSHALNFFTTRGEWHNTLDGRSGKLQGSGTKARRSLVGRVISTKMDTDDESVSVESHASKENASEGDDGNSSHCIVCFDGGNIVCCSKCPRAYHPKCLAKDGHTAVNIDLLPNDWQCNRCKKDFSVMPGEEIPQFQFGNKKIRAAYADFKGCEDHNYCCTLLSNLLDILNKLKNYDYGFVFSEPVDLNDVPDYLGVVKTPMDYGTVFDRLEGGNYVDLIASDDVARDDEISTMEEILLHVLCDIERVHHNCRLFNKKGSSIYRIGDLHASKWNAYFSQYIEERLPENVYRDLTRFRQRCELELQEDTRTKKRRKAEAKKAAEKARRVPMSPPVVPRKRKASEPLDEEDEGADEEEGEAHIGDGDDDEEEDEELQRKAKKAKRSIPAPHSSALIFTEDQIRSLENVFFSSPAKLREEAGEDASSAPAPHIASSPIANEDDKNDHQSAPGVGEGSSGALVEANMEEDQHEPPRKDPDPPPAGDISSPKVPELIISRPTEISRPALPEMSSSALPDESADVIDVDKTASSAAKASNAPSMGGSSTGTTFQRQWYDRLNELKQYKIIHGTAVVSATKNDKLYHWRLRQRKRYHLTLFRMPNLKKDSRRLDETGGDKKDGEWLLSMPEMKGVFALSASSDVEDDADSAPKAFTISEERAAPDEETADVIRRKHFEQLYCPPGPTELLVSRHSSRHATSLFWDECLEELRFFQGEHQNTLVPRDFPHNSYLPLWVEIQRARFLLQSIGLFSGLTGSQMLVLDELNICDLSSLKTTDGILANGTLANGAKIPQISGDEKGGRAKIKDDPNSPERKSWSTHARDFKKWFERLSPEKKAKAGELLPKSNWPLYSWCWRQCNASSAVLCGTPNLSGVNMSVKKLGILASSKFFHAFPYNDRNGLVREDDYEGSDAFDSTYLVLEDFSIKYSSTLIPDWYECDQAFRMWVGALENGLAEFVKGEPCVLSVRQIEKLILIGFCNDRAGLPNLSKGDVVWLKMFVELKRHRELFGVCHVSSDFPRLHQWLAQQKDLFRLSRMGRKGMMNLSRFKMLMEAGVDFFTGECLPGTANIIEGFFKEFDQTTSSPMERFPAQESGMQENRGWIFQCDSYWNDHECRAKFEQLKEKSGHSLVLAADDEGLYWWFVEKRGKMLLCELSSAKSGQVDGSNELHSHSILRYIKSQQQGDSEIQFDYPMFLWMHYCERLMMFKARKGHCKVPKDYPDGPLQQWLRRQQELIHLYSINQPTELLPVQLKLLHALGVHGSKRQVTPPKLSSRTLKRKHPSRKGVGHRRHQHGEAPEKKEKKIDKD